MTAKSIRAIIALFHTKASVRISDSVRMKTEITVHYIYKFSSYLIENKVCFSYKDESANVR